MMTSAGYRAMGRRAFYSKRAQAIGTMMIMLLFGLILQLVSGLGPNTPPSFSVNIGGQTLGFTTPWDMFADMAAQTPVVAVVFLGIIGLYPALQMGISRFNLELVDGKNVKATDILKEISRLGRALWVTALMIFRTAMLALPGMAVMYASLLAPSYALAMLALVAGGIGMLVGAAVGMLAYGMSMYVLVDEPSLSSWQATKRSAELMKGHKWRYFCLKCSFLGWMLLSELTQGILHTLFVGPYMEATSAVFYRERTREV